MNANQRLLSAAMGRSLEGMQHAMREGADINFRGETGNTALRLAIISQNPDLLAFVLGQEGVDVNQLSGVNNIPPLLVADDYSNAHAYDRLARHPRTNLDATCTVSGDTAVARAARRGDLALVRRLFSLGAHTPPNFAAALAEGKLSMRDVLVRIK